MKENKTPPSLILNTGHDNTIYIVPSQNKAIIYIGVDFNQKTDISLARVVLQELEDSKRHIRGVMEAKYFPDTSKAPGELSSLETNPTRFSCGIISFSKDLIN